MNSEPRSINATVETQRAFFATGATLSTAFRRKRLEALREAIRNNEQAIFSALDTDLRKGDFETYTSEIGILYDEIRYVRRHLRRWTRPRRVSTPIVHAPARSRVVHRPLGVSAIFAPWNYPVQLSLAPLVSAIAAGNCAIIKPSEFAPESSRVIAQLVADTFDPAHVTVIEGDGFVASELSTSMIDHIFFTGSTRIGKDVMRIAAERLTPVTLELGGKSPAIVLQDADVKLAARRIAWGAYLNAGQTCVAPDFILVHQDIVDRFSTALVETIREMYGELPAESPDLSRIVDDRHFDRLVDLLNRERESGSEILFGGDYDAPSRYIAPTALTGCNWNGPLMEDEIFGPLVPIIPISSFDEAVAMLNARPHPLAAYLFTRNRATIRRFEREVAFGSASINDTVVHLVNPALPFGGFGPSGIGSYHGYAGFRAFSHEAGIMQRATWIDVPLRYPPYGNALSLIRRIMRP